MIAGERAAIQHGLPFGSWVGDRGADLPGLAST